MKKLTLTIVLAFIAFVFVSAQGCLPEGITFTTQMEIDSFQVNYPGCTEIEGDVEIGVNNAIDSISDLSGLSVITSIGGNITFIACEILTNLDGMEGLTSIGGSLTIARNGILSSLEGLSNLSSIGGGLGFNYNGFNLNGSLTSLEGLENLITIPGDVHINANPNLESLSGLDNLTSVGGSLEIGCWMGPGNESLSSLSSLGNLTSVGSYLVISYNPSLTSLDGLGSINSIGGFLQISGNNLLSECDIASICEYLVAPNGTITIENNAPGCNSQEEVEEACEEITNIEDSEEIKFTIYPNPTDNGIITITLDNPDNLHMECFNTFGQQVYQQQISSVETLINISTWSPGIYLAVVYEQGKAVGRTKFIVR